MSATSLFIVINLFWASFAAGHLHLPTVDLGYSVYRATALNVRICSGIGFEKFIWTHANQDTGAYYNFSNIRYAAPPVGRLRFADPAPPLVDRAVQNGSVGNVCIQSAPGYFGGAVKGLGELINSFPQAVASQMPSEDCLFLDVIAPIRLFDGAGSNTSSLAPVLVNIYGGGFSLGDKNTNYDPQGLLQQSRNGIIYVSMNYRVSNIPSFPQALNFDMDNSSVPLASWVGWSLRLKTPPLLMLDCSIRGSRLNGSRRTSTCLVEMRNE